MSDFKSISMRGSNPSMAVSHDGNGTFLVTAGTGGCVLGRQDAIRLRDWLTAAIGDAPADDDIGYVTTSDSYQARPDKDGEGQEHPPSPLRPTGGLWNLVSTVAVPDPSSGLNVLLIWTWARRREGGK